MELDYRATALPDKRLLTEFLIEAFGFLSIVLAANCSLVVTVFPKRTGHIICNVQLKAEPVTSVTRFSMPLEPNIDILPLSSSLSHLHIFQVAQLLLTWIFCPRCALTNLHTFVCFYTVHHTQFYKGHIFPQYGFHKWSGPGIIPATPI